MFGKLLSDMVKIVTVPIDICEAGIDCITGGDGKKSSRQRLADDVPMLSTPRDAVCDVLESLDD